MERLKTRMTFYYITFKADPIGGEVANTKKFKVTWALRLEAALKKPETHLQLAEPAFKSRVSSEVLFGDFCVGGPIYQISMLPCMYECM